MILLRLFSVLLILADEGICLRLKHLQNNDEKLKSSKENLGKLNEMNSNQLDQVFHAVVGTPHMSHAEDQKLLETSAMMDSPAKEQLKSAEVRFQNVMDGFEELMNVAESMKKRRKRSTSSDVAQKNIYDDEEVRLNNEFEHAEDVKVDTDFLDAMASLDELMYTTEAKRRKRAASDSDYKDKFESLVFEKLEEILEILAKSSHKLEMGDKKGAYRMLEKAKALVRNLNKEVEQTDDGILSRHSRSVKDVHKTDNEGFSNPIQEDLVTRGFTEDEYYWLQNEFSLSKEEADGLKAMSPEEFAQLIQTLRGTTSTEGEEDYSVSDLLAVLTEARQLVPSEVAAAAEGAVEVGWHLGGRAAEAVSPVVKVVRERVLPGATRLAATAVDSLPEDVRDWAAEGGRIAARRAEMVAEYAGPRLARLASTADKMRETLQETAGDAMAAVVPALVPSFQSAVDELRDTIQLAREMIPPRAEAAYNSVADKVSPVAATVRQSIRKTGPSIKDALKSSLNAVFTGVPKVIQKLSHEAHDAAKVFKGKYKSALKKMRSMPQSLPAGEETTSKAKEL